MAQRLGGSATAVAEGETFDSFGEYRPTVSLIDDRFELFVRANAASIAKDAAKIGIGCGDLERQIRLHLPSVDLELLHQARYRQAYAAIQGVARARAAAIHEHQLDVGRAAGMELLRFGTFSCKKDLSLEGTGGSRIPLEFAAIKPSLGNDYQSNLHYLRAVRGDTSLHYGVFLPGTFRPMAYIALSSCDRPYMIEGIGDRVGGGLRNYLVLTRMYGLPGLPTNLMSMMTKHLIRALRGVSQARVIITAYNPLLGFRGTVYRASGFHSFAMAPVEYGYDRRGEYTTRRLGNTVTVSGHKTPPNVLMARGTDRWSQAALDRYALITQISAEDYRDKMTAHQDDSCGQAELAAGVLSLMQGRKIAKTVMLVPRGPCHRVGPQEHVSCAGRCDVGAIWLIREIKRLFGVQASYCYGTVFWSEPSCGYRQRHSWVEVKGSRESDRLVIDPTVVLDGDRGGEPVVGMHSDHLASLGVHYRAEGRLTIDQLPTQAVWSRFEMLDDALFRAGEMIATF